MRMSVLALAVVLVASNHLGECTEHPRRRALTLAEAMRLAETAHPAVRAREAQLTAAEGSRREAARCSSAIRRSAQMRRGVDSSR